MFVGIYSGLRFVLPISRYPYYRGRESLLSASLRCGYDHANEMS